MPKRYRRALQLTYLLFFIVFAAFLLVNSFGYRFNPSTRTINTSATIETRTAPFDSTITVKPTSFSTNAPAEVSIVEAGNYTIEVSKQGYTTESFRLYYPGGKNTRTSLAPLYLLPTQASTSYVLPGSLVSILDGNLILTRDGATFSIVTVSPAGILSAQSVAIPSNLAALVPLAKFTKLHDTVFWSPGSPSMILAKRGEGWNISALPTALNEPIGIVGTNNSLLVLGKNKQLYSWNYTSEPVFIDSQVQGLAGGASGLSAWVWKDDWIQQVNLSSPLAQQLSPRTANFASSALLAVDSTRFKVSTVYQGFAVLIGETLLYRPDFNQSDFISIAQGVKDFSAASDTLYWVTDSNLSFANLRSGQRALLSDQVPSGVNSFWYDPYWSRLVVATSSSVYTLWHDNDKMNEAIGKYNLTTWLTDTQCENGFQGGVALCTKNNTAQFYINREFVF